jgi:hypothetical protein
MYVVRDIFHLNFGQYRDVKKLMDEAVEKKMFPETQNMKVLTDFTGDSYRLIMEETFNSLADYEKSMASGMDEAAWREWYEKFKKHVKSSHREILKQIM